MVILDSHVRGQVRTSNSSAFPLNFKVACPTGPTLDIDLEVGTPV